MHLTVQLIPQILAVVFHSTTTFEANREEEYTEECTCCLFHSRLPFGARSFLLAQAVLVQLEKCRAAVVGECWFGHQGILSGRQTVITGAAQLCHEATALKRSSVVFHACRNQFDCRADLNLGNALGFNLLSTTSVSRLKET